MMPFIAYAEKTILQTELSPSEIVKLKNNELILKIKEVEKSAWPELTVFVLVDSTPLESMGIFSALDYQHVYVPNVISSRPIKNISATEILTEYEMHVPFPLPNAIYTHGSIINKYEDDYELTWYMVKSTSTEEVKGSAYFTQFQGKTLFRYKSFIRPKSMFGALVKSIMVSDVKKTIMAIRAHIIKLKNEKSPLLLKYSEYISRSLNGEFVYNVSN
jgi:hypothetical protein